jgi:hypothetical protein
VFPARKELKKDLGTGEDCIMRSFIICTAHEILSDQIKKNEMGGACGTYGVR